MGYASMQMLFAGKPRKTRKRIHLFWYIESLKILIIPFLFKSSIKISIKNRERVSYRIHTFNSHIKRAAEVMLKS